MPVTPGGTTFNMLTGAIAPRAGVNQVQSLTTTSSPSAGTFVINVSALVKSALGLAGTVSGVIQWNTTAAQLQTILDTFLGAGNCTVAGTAMPSGTITITMIGKLAGFSWAVWTTTDTITGGAMAISITTPGVAATGRGCEVGCKYWNSVLTDMWVNTGTIYAPVWTAYLP